MTRGREAHEQILSVPVTVGPLSSEYAGPALAGPASSAKWEISGRRSRAEGTLISSTLTMAFPDGTSVDVDSDTGVAANYVAYPGLLRRERFGTDGSTVETAVCPPELPCVIVQWAGAGPRMVTVRWAGAETVPGRSGAAFVVDGTMVGAVHADAALSVDVDDDGTTRIRFPTDPSTDRSIVVSSGDPAAVRRSLTAAQHIGGHAVRAARGAGDEVVRLESGVPEIDDGFSWLVSRLAGSWSSRRSTPDDRLTFALACLAVGLPDTARAELTELGQARAHDAYLSARLALATGRDGEARRVTDDLLADAGSPVDPLLRDALGALADGLRYGATADVQDELRRRARSVRAEGDGTRRLPTIGGSAATRASWWHALVEGNAVHDGDDEGLRSLASLFRRDPDEAWSRWRLALGKGLEEGTDQLGRWSANGDTEATLALAFVHGLLGYASDAPSGRFVLKPNIPSHWRSFEVSGLPSGEGTFGLRYDRAGTNHTFDIHPERGAVPVILVLEPTVVGTIESIRIDGEEAALSGEVAGERFTTRLQLPLDGRRQVELRGT